MLGKLLKYDFRSVSREYMLLWPAALVIALVMRFTIFARLDTVEDNLLANITNVLTVFIYVAVLVAMFIITLLFIIQRFYKGILGSEGYLMNTLPVRPWQLVTSKLICAMVLLLVSMAVAGLSVFLMIPISLQDIIQVDFSMLWDRLMEVFPSFLLLVAELVLCSLVGMVASITQLYFSMALGNLFGKNRLIGSIVSYVGISMVLNILYTVVSMVLSFSAIGSQYRWDLDPALFFHAITWFAILSSAALAAIFFFGTTYILKNRLNLE